MLINTVKLTTTSDYGKSATIFESQFQLLLNKATFEQQLLVNNDHKFRVPSVVVVDRCDTFLRFFTCIKTNCNIIIKLHIDGIALPKRKQGWHAFFINWNFLFHNMSGKTPTSKFLFKMNFWKKWAINLSSSQNLPEQTFLLSSHFLWKLCEVCRNHESLELNFKKLNFVLLQFF